MIEVEMRKYSFLPTDLIIQATRKRRLAKTKKRVETLFVLTNLIYI